MSATILPFVWATAARLPVLAQHAADAPLEPQMYFYRRYTEALLRRYIRMSMEAGKVPSLIPKEMFRGKVTGYRVGNFDDVVIFVADIDRCLAQLDQHQRDIIAYMAIQQYTVEETARLLGVVSRTVIRKYAVALDRLSRIFLNAKMLEPLKTCQEWLDS